MVKEEILRIEESYAFENIEGYAFSSNILR